MIKVYYDGKCGLCSKEISFYKKIAPKDKIEWYDIATNPAPLEKINITQDQALKLLHVQDQSGKIHIGVAAFCVIWRELPYWKWLAPIVSFPIILWPLNAFYKIFANWRFKRLSHCQISSTQQNNLILKKYKAENVDVPLSFMPWMRSNHAGETGAVWIYKGAKCAFWSPKIQKIATEQLQTEQQHLTVMEHLTPKKERSIFLPLWRLMGFSLGFAPSLFGYRAFSITIHAVESFVEKHYKEQIDILNSKKYSDTKKLSAIIQKCCAEEVEHQNEASEIAFPPQPKFFAKLWKHIVGHGSHIAVSISKWK